MAIDLSIYTKKIYGNNKNISKNNFKNLDTNYGP